MQDCNTNTIDEEKDQHDLDVAYQMTLETEHWNDICAQAEWRDRWDCGGERW